MTDNIKNKYLFYIIFVLFSLSAGNTLANTSEPDTIPYQIDIGGLEYVSRGADISIPVFKIAGSEPIQEFGFSIGYDRTFSTFLGVTPGELFDIPGSFEWEYLSFQEELFQYPVYDTLYPPGQGYYIKVTGIADTVNEPHQPIELIVPDSTVLFYLEFHVSYNI